MREPVFTETMQISIVVRDLQKTLRTYVEEYGIGPWEIYDFNPETVTEMTTNDAPAEYAFRIAVTMVGSVQWELVQPLEDKGVFAEFLATKGEGVHHVAVGGRGYAETLEALRAKGHGVVQGGQLQRRHLRLRVDRSGPRRHHRDLRLARGLDAGARRGLPTRLDVGRDQKWIATSSGM